MKRLFAFMSLLRVIGWAGYLLFAGPLARLLTARWGAKIVQAGDGKISDPALFLQHRFFEGAYLLTLALLAVGLTVLVGLVVARRLPALWKWVPYALAGFVSGNVWVKLAAGTALFWCLFWNGKGTTHNLAQYHIKLLLMDENSSPIKAVMLGSSQVHAQIDPRLLNAQLQPQLVATDLAFPWESRLRFSAFGEQAEAI
jgi:hypothetical protein